MNHECLRKKTQTEKKNQIARILQSTITPEIITGSFGLTKNVDLERKKKLKLTESFLVQNSQASSNLSQNSKMKLIAVFMNFLFDG